MKPHPITKTIAASTATPNTPGPVVSANPTPAAEDRADPALRHKKRKAANAAKVNLRKRKKSSGYAIAETVNEWKNTNLLLL